jgi:hypothetical protein
MGKREYDLHGSLDMERAMGAASWSQSGVRRVMAISGATAAVIVALLFGKPFYSATADTKVPISTEVGQRFADQEPALEIASSSTSIGADSDFFFGCGDGSNGYYAERPEPMLALVRYERMP